MHRILILTLIACLVPFLASADTLSVYASLTGKTVLMPSALPAVPDSVVSDLPSDPTEAIAKIENALAEKGITVVQDGPHFVRVVRNEGRDALTNAPLRGAELAASRGSETMPAGMIDFVNADLNQVLSIYAMMSQRTILRSTILPASTIRLKTQGALSKEEVLYAFATALALNGICLVDDSTSFVQMVPVSRRDQVKTRAPKPEPGAKLFDPKKVPSVGVLPSGRPLTEMERLEQEFDRLRKSFYDFMHLPDPSRRPASRLLGLYADLAGKTPVASQNLDGTGIWFHVETPLTKSELLYAIETTFLLNNLAIIPVDEHNIRVGHISELRKGD